MSMDYGDLSNSLAAWYQALLPQINTADVTVAAKTQAFASALAEFYGYLDATALQAFLNSSSGDGLTAKAAEAGVQRFLGDPSTASLTVTLTGAQPTGYQIDQTFQFSTTGDALNAPVIFVPSAVVPITPGQLTATVPVTSSTVGLATAVLAGTITGIVNNTGNFIVAVTNAAAASGGQDQQQDPSLLSQAQAALAPASAVLQMQKTAGTVTNIAAAVAVDLADTHGTINLYALDTANTLTGATVTPYQPTPLFLQDSMTGTAATSITAHTGEVGATWTQHASHGTGAAVIDAAGRLRSNIASTLSLFYASGVSPASPEYDVWADLYVGSVLNMAGVVGRVVTGADTYYLGRYNSTTAGWELYKVVAGTATQLSTTAAQTLTVGNTYRLKLQLRNGSQKLLVSTDGGVTYTTKVTGSDADAALTAAGRVGVYFNDGATVSTDTTGLHIDYLSAVGPGSADLGTSEALTIQSTVRAVSGPGLTLQVAQLAITTANVTVTSCTQVAGSGLTAAIVSAAITAYLNAFAPGVTFVPSALIQYLMATAYPGLLSDVQLSTLTPVTVTSTGIIRAGTVAITVGP